MTRAAVLALPALLWASAAGARFAPPEGRTFLYAVTDTRGTGEGAPIVTTSERRVTFRKLPGGYGAELTVVSVEMTGPPAVAAMAGNFMKTLIGRTIRYRLDGGGAVIAVEDQAALIADVVAALRAMGGDGPNRGDAAAKVAQSVAAAPEPAQRAMLASLLTGAIAADRTEAPAGTRAVTVPAAALGKAVTLPGRETVQRRADRVTITDQAEGAVGQVVSAAPGADAAAGAPHLRVVDRVDLDPETGLLVSSERMVESWIDAAPDRRRVTHITATLSQVS